MNSEVNTNLTLSFVTPVKTDNGSPKPTINKAVNLNQDDKAKHDERKNVLSLDSIKAATDQSNQLLQAVKLNVQYSVDSSTKEVVIKVVDSDSGDLVRQIPSAEMLDFVKRLQDLENKQHGAVIQTRA